MPGRLLDSLARLRKHYPDMRLGQIMAYFSGPETDCLFFMTDEEMTAKIEIVLENGWEALNDY